MNRKDSIRPKSRQIDDRQLNAVSIDSAFYSSIYPYSLFFIKIKKNKKALTLKRTEKTKKKQVKRIELHLAEIVLIGKTNSL